MGFQILKGVFLAIFSGAWNVKENLGSFIGAGPRLSWYLLFSVAGGYKQKQSLVDSLLCGVFCHISFFSGSAAPGASKEQG